MVTKATLEPNALAINLYTILPVADADHANWEIALGAGKQHSVSKSRIYFCDLLHCRTTAVRFQTLIRCRTFDSVSSLFGFFIYAAVPD
jgi:hypothetical protein